jgi:hypothetical protein
VGGVVKAESHDGMKHNVVRSLVHWVKMKKMVKILSDPLVSASTEE